jgi:hypothetical protein
MAEALARKSYRVETNSTILPYIVRDHAWNLPMHDASGSYFRYRDDAPSGYKEHFETDDEEHGWKILQWRGEVIGRTDDVVCDEGDEECEADAADYEDEDYADEDEEDEEAEEDGEDGEEEAEEGATEEVDAEADPALAKKSGKKVHHAAEKTVKSQDAKKQASKVAKPAVHAKNAGKKTLHKKHNPKNKWITDPSHLVKAPTAKPINQAVKEIQAKHDTTKIAAKAIPAVKK